MAAAQTPPEWLRRRGRTDRLGRRLVQAGFLLLFLLPFAPVVYSRLTSQASRVLTSWLLPWDPLLLLGRLSHRESSGLVVGGALLLLALTFVLGRFFCSWICPLGTVLDAISALAIWRRRQKRRPPRPAHGFRRWFFPRDTNSPLRFALLIVVLAAGILSLQPLGVLDPLVLFHRMSSVGLIDAFEARQDALRAFFSAASLVFLSMLALELWQPRFWCRNLCPLGALLGLASRWSLLNRRVSTACNRCKQCRAVCTMNAIPIEPHDTRVMDCTQCLACEAACPNAGITFGFGLLAGKRWQRSGRTAGEYVPRTEPAVSRRGFVYGFASVAMGAALIPAIRLVPREPVIRPPGALPEDQFVRTCILCQECVRVCPTHGLRPLSLVDGPTAAGTPHLVARAGACTLNPNCPHLCASVCPVAAIRPIAPSEMKLGLAEVQRSACLAWDQQVKCLVCVEACLNDAAQMFDGRIVVDPNRCTGCGRCENACPVAGAAIHIFPRKRP